MFATPPSQKVSGTARQAGTINQKQQQDSAMQQPIVAADKYLRDAKSALAESGNIKTTIKETVTKSLIALHGLVLRLNERLQDQPKIDLSEELTKQYSLTEETNKKLDAIQTQIAEITRTQQEISDNTRNATFTYADALAGRKNPVNQKPNHTLIITSTEEEDSSEDVLDKVRKAIDAKEGGICVDRVRKAKNQKVVISCNSEENLRKVTEKIQATRNLQAEKATNKDPLVIVRDVLAYNTDEEVVAAIRKQNGYLVRDIPDEEYRAVVKYRRRARNPLENHVILQVSPKVYQALVTVGAIYIDMQKRVVRDQSPLIQCTICLGFGHGKKLCTETQSLCSHCSGPHLRAECPIRAAGELAACRNCNLAKLDKVNHNAFDFECPIKKKWDSLARTSVAYC